MLLTIKDFFKKTPKDGDKLAAISDKIWKLGSLEEIKEKTTPELFIVHISMNMIGNHQCDGWHSIITDHADFISYIPGALDELGLPNIKKAFQNLLSVFPDFVVFSNEDASYTDIINFLTNVRFKVADERLNKYSKEERGQLVKQYHAYLDELEELSKPLWGYGAPNDGWESVLNYISHHINLKKSN